MIGHRKRIKMAMSGRSYELYASSTAIVGIIYSNKKPNCKRVGRKKIRIWQKLQDRRIKNEY